MRLTRDVRACMLSALHWQRCLSTEENVDPKTVQGILRHASSDITMEMYPHAQDDTKRKALEKFESRLVQ